MQTDLASRREARAGLAVFFALLTPLTLAGYWLWLRHFHLLLIFVPAIASIATRLIRREGFRDVSFGLGKGFWRACLIALGVPLAVCVIAYGTAWGLGLVQFAPARLPPPIPNLADPTLNFVWTVGLALIAGSLSSLPFAGGEEIGWRGYMLTRLVAAGVKRPLLVSGLIWAGWHVPLILLAAYAPGSGPPVLAALIFVVVATAYAFVLGGLRLSSGSIWPPMLAHSAWNSLTQQAFDPAVKPGLWPWLGESGLLQAGVTVAVVMVAMRLLPRRAMAFPYR